jgi:sugar O-acyltransferase (sialic acid O-acetyltransferase NeuD family)
MKKLIIFPFNGNGIEAMDCIVDEYELIAFADDTAEKQGLSEFGIPVASREVILQYPEAYILAVPGSSASYKIRKQIIEALNIPISRFARVIHPSASVAKYASIGYNSLIMAGVVLTNTSRVGNHVCILPNSVIHHDSVIGDYSLVGSSVVVAGNSIISENCYIGSGTNIINNIHIGGQVLVGMGSNVIRSVASSLTVAGNPAAILPAK